MDATRAAFVDIDTQVDFIDPAGRLYVPGAERIVPQLERLVTFARRRHLPILSTMDAHSPDDPEFKDWPAHCVIGTPGQQKIPQTLLDRSLTIAPEAAVPPDWRGLLEAYGQLIFPKATLSAFDHPYFASAVEHLGNREFIVFGVATDYCVRLAARGLLERGRRVQLVRDAIRAVDVRAARRACRELEELGAAWTTCDEVIGTAGGSE